MLAFGGYLSGYNFVDYFHRSLDNILIGRYWGAQALGFYSKAYGLLMQPVIQIGAPITAIIVPALSRLQDDPARYRGYFLTAAKTAVFLGMPFVVFTYVDAREIILTLLGAPWLPVVPLFKTLAPAAFLGTMSMFGNWLYQSLGRTDRMFKSGTAVLGVMIVAFLCGLPWGGIGIAAAYSIAYSLVALPTVAYATRGTPVTLADIAAAVWRPFIISIACGGVTMGFKSAFRAPEVLAARCFIDGAFFCLAYAISWFFFPGGREFLRSISGPFIRWRQDLLKREVIAGKGAF
jgi:PST family polysaccharide transporter